MGPHLWGTQTWPWPWSFPGAMQTALPAPSFLVGRFDNGGCFLPKEKCRGTALQPSCPYLVSSWACRHPPDLLHGQGTIFSSRKNPNLPAWAWPRMECHWLLMAGDSRVVGPSDPRRDALGKWGARAQERPRGSRACCSQHWPWVGLGCRVKGGRFPK